MASMTKEPVDGIDEAEDGAPNYVVAAVDRALKLLTLVGDMPGLGLSELSRLSGTSKARTFRLLQTMEGAGFVQRKGTEASYWLSHQALRLTVQAERQLDLVRLGQPVLDAIGPRSDETAQIRVRQGLESLCLCKWETSRIIRYHASVGRASPLYAGASKILLAYAPANVREAVLAAPRQSFTAGTPVDEAALLRDLAQIRATGHCVSRGEVAPEAFSAGAAIFDATGTVVGAFLIAAPLVRASGSRADELLSLARQGAADISRALGHS